MRCRKGEEKCQHHAPTGAENSGEDAEPLFDTLKVQ